MLKNLLKIFKDPTDIYLTPAMRKKKRKLSRTTFTYYSVFSFLFLSWVILALSVRYKLFEKNQDGQIKLSGWILLILILIIYFGTKKILKKFREIADSPRSVWSDQMFVIVPLIITLGITVFIHNRIGDVVYVLGHVLVARVVFTPINVLYLRANRKLELFKSNLDKHIENKSQDDFNKEFNV